MQGVISK